LGQRKKSPVTYSIKIKRAENKKKGRGVVGWLVGGGGDEERKEQRGEDRGRQRERGKERG
jgi:hypothetical protein